MASVFWDSAAGFLATAFSRSGSADPPIFCAGGLLGALASFLSPWRGLLLPGFHILGRLRTRVAAANALAARTASCFSGGGAQDAGLFDYRVSLGTVRDYP
jgi:hypothetical protein